MAATDRKAKVCVIGAGLSGLLALKECLSEGFDVQCFEARPELGGQWAQQPDATPDSSSEDVQSSIYDGVVLNSCRDTSAMPDFPLDPARYPDYFSHRLQLRYMREYADHFRLHEHIHLGTRVVACEPRGDGGWSVRVRRGNNASGGGHEEKEDLMLYDAVLVCVGHLSTPSTPDFAGRDAFRGQLLHSHYYRRPGPFERKRVVLIGFGSSAVDIACELAPGAEEVHVVTRRGGWVLPRYVLGKPTEAWDNRATQVWIPVNTAQWLQTKLLNIVEGKPPAVMLPKHKLLEQSPTVRGDFIEKVRTGVITIHRGNVERLTEDGLVVSRADGNEKEKKNKKTKKHGDEDGKEEELLIKADVVIACTGYNLMDYPFLPKDTLRRPDTPADRVDLYKLIAPPDHPNLFVLGHAEPVGPAAPVFDAQARWACAVVSGRIRLPPADEMRASARALHRWQERHFVGSARHALAAYAVPYVDELLEPLGARPSLRRCLGRVVAGGGGSPWRALRVLVAVWFGIPSSAQWRLFGYGARAELATATLLRIADGAEGLSEAEIRLLGADGQA